MNAAWLPRAVVAVAVALPVAYATLASLRPALDTRAWVDVAALPGFGRAWTISVVTALAATLVAALLAWHICARWVQPRPGSACVRGDDGSGQAWLGPMLAMPHAAFAIGSMLLLAPAGWLARLIAWPLGWDAPPAAGLLVDTPLVLFVVLVAKEAPFLMWTTLSSLRRADARGVLDAADRQAALLGHSPARRWWLVHLPMHVRRLAWPVLAVLAYGLAVVDVPLVTGPSLPPPLAVLAWENIVDPDPAREAAGAAAAWLLVASVALLALAGALVAPLGARVVARLASNGPSAARGRQGRATMTWRALSITYAAVAAALWLASVSGPWPFPQWLPQSWTGDAWLRVLDAAPRVAYSFALATASASAGVLLVVAWLASTPPGWDRGSMVAAMATVLLPSLLLSLGLYELMLRLRLDATHTGLLWSHLPFAGAYAMLVLAGPWRSIDRRWIDTARIFGHGPWSRLLRVQLPLLRAPLAAAWAVAFAVGIAQFLPTQLIGAGRITTLATEAVTLASAGQRNVAAATALLLALLPCVIFVLAARRRSERTAPP